MSARIRRFGAFSSRSGRGKAAGAVIACAALLLAGCGGSDAADAGGPVIRGDAGGDKCEPATGSWTATAAVGGVTRTVIFTAPTYTSPWTKFTATANTGQSATISTSASSGSIQLRGLTKKANNTFIVKGTTADGCIYTSPTSTTVSGAVTAVVAPGIPTISTVTAGDAKATVTVAAATTGGTPASYTVTASPAVTGGSCTVTGASGSCDVTGLSNGTEYTFTATATNTGGTSAASAPSTPVTPVTVPGAPTIGAVAAAGPTSATVAFTAPASNGGSTINTYTATSTPGGFTATASTAGTITVTGLTLGTSYTFTVTATNATGTSAPSAESGSVTPVITTYLVGETGPGGGRVFYVSASGFTSTGSACGTSCHYLEVAPRPWTEANWCNLTTTAIPGVFGTSIGSGFENTRLMITGGCTSGAGNLAQATTRTVNGMTFSDWFLPSQDELHAALELKWFAGDSYWSSSQPSGNSQLAWLESGTMLFKNATSKAFKLYAPPVRAF